MLVKKLSNLIINNGINPEKDDFELYGKILSNVPGNVIWKDTESRVLCANEKMIKELGFKRLSQLSGLTAKNYNCKMAEISDSLMTSHRHDSNYFD